MDVGVGWVVAAGRRGSERKEHRGWIESLEKRSMLTDVCASLAILPIEVGEGASFSVAVTLTDPNWTPGAQPPVVHPATTVTLQFAGTATQGDDYTISSTTISIPPWSGQSVGGSITLAVLRDNRVEGDEQIEISVGAGAGYTLQQPAGTITTTTRTTVIKDDPPRVSIWIAEGQTGAVREATLTEPFGGDEPGQVIVYVLRSGGGYFDADTDHANRRRCRVIGRLLHGSRTIPSGWRLCRVDREGGRR